MGLDFGVGSIEFDGLLESGDRIDGSAENVSLRVAIDVACRLLEFVDLGFALKCVEKEDSLVFGQSQAGGDLGKLGFGEFLVVSEFLVEFHGLGSGSVRGPVFLVLLGGGPVHEGVREFLPVFALGAVVADAVSFHFVLAGELVGAVFEDETVRGVLGGGGRCEKKDEQREKCDSVLGWGAWVEKWTSLIMMRAGRGVEWGLLLTSKTATQRAQRNTEGIRSESYGGFTG